MTVDKGQAVQSDAMKQPLSITWRDLKFEVAPFDDWALSFSHHMERERLTLALECALGPTQYGLFMASDPAPRLTEAQQLIVQITTAAGVTPGE